MLRANPPLYYQLHKVWSYSWRPSVITRMVHHCLESLWENLEQQWLCAVLLLCRNKGTMHLKRKITPWCVTANIYGNLTDFSSAMLQNRGTSAIKRNFHCIFTIYKYFLILSRLNCYPLCLNRILNSNLASLTLRISSEFY